MMNIQATPLSFDSETDHLIGPTPLSQGIKPQLRGRSLSAGQPSYELGGRLSLEVVKYVCDLANQSYPSRLHISTVGEVARYVGVTSAFAEPIMPLQQRDRTILIALFDRDDMSDIHTDITDRLDTLIIEPCWDDDPYAFLSEYL